MSEIKQIIDELAFRLTWVDVCQVLLLWAALYWLLRVMRRTRGLWYIFSLLGTVLGLSLLFSLWHMPALELLFGGFLKMMPILVVVLFKEDLRKLLERLYNSLISQFTYNNKSSEEILIDAISSSVMAMATTKTGCLIAIEKTEDLRPFITNAKIIDAAIDPQNLILQNIFFKGAPLHDGGVIIRGGRIWAAACTFPQCENPETLSRYGLRHQAAMGMSEKHPDAVVIVVSEETGHVHVVYKAVMGEIQSESQLSDVLRGHLCAKSTVQRSAKVFFLKWFRKERNLN